MLKQTIKTAILEVNKIQKEIEDHVDDGDEDDKQDLIRKKQFLNQIKENLREAKHLAALIESECE